MTKKDAYLQPSAEELIYCLSEHSYFTKQVDTFKSRLLNQIKRKQFFLIPDEHYEFNVLAQGLTNAPVIFQGVMSHLIATDRWNYIAIYLDDIVIFSHSISIISLRYILSLMLFILKFLLQIVQLLFTRYNFLVILLLRVFSEQNTNYLRYSSPSSLIPSESFSR